MLSDGDGGASRLRAAPPEARTACGCARPILIGMARRGSRPTPHGFRERRVHDKAQAGPAALVVAGLSLGSPPAATMTTTAERRQRSDARPHDRRLGPAQRRPCATSARRREGGQSRRRARSTRRSTRPAPITPSSSSTEDNCGGADQQCAVQAARKMVESDNASCIAGAWASADTIPTAESVAIPRRGPADLAGVDQRRDHRPRGRRTGQPDRSAGLVPGPDAGRRTWSRRLSEAPRARRSTSAPATTPTGPGSPTRSATPGRQAGGTIGERRRLRPRAAELRLRGGADRLGQPGRDRDHRLPGDLQQGRSGAGAHGTSIRRRRSSPMA